MKKRIKKNPAWSLGSLIIILPAKRLRLFPHPTPRDKYPGSFFSITLFVFSFFFFAPSLFSFFFFFTHRQLLNETYPNDERIKHYLQRVFAALFIICKLSLAILIPSIFFIKENYNNHCLNCLQTFISIFFLQLFNRKLSAFLVFKIMSL